MQTDIAFDKMTVKKRFGATERKYMKENQKYFAKNEMYRNNISDIVGEDETILWEGAPKKSAYIAAAFLKMLPIVILWLAVDITIIVVLAGLEGVPWFAWIFFAIHLAPVWIWIANIIHAVAELKNVRYAITDKRIIIRSGVIVDLKFMYFTEITNVRVRVGVVDRLLKVGDIYITAEVQKAVLYDIAAPYTVANEIQRLVRDIKSDTFYPNALRPETNQGYRTKYVAGEGFGKLSDGTSANKPATHPADSPTDGSNSDVIE